MKQIIVMRKDLGMTAGKMVAQGAHASMGAVLAHREDPRVAEWLAGAFTKVCLRVESEEDLIKIYDEANKAGLITQLIVDSGKTIFHGIPTVTCCAIGPDTHENLHPITGHLKLL